jgi:hypothetical protein
MYIRKLMHSDFVVPKWIGAILQWYGFDHVFRGGTYYIFLKQDFHAIKLPFYIKFLMKYGECKRINEVK